MTFYLRHGNVHAVPVLHYSMEFACHVRLVFQHLSPDCVAVELPETLEEPLLNATSRLPDISVLIADQNLFMVEPCEPSFEGLRSALDAGVAAHCIDLDVREYPDHFEPFPDAYATLRIGLHAYYAAYAAMQKDVRPTHVDTQRELHMAKRLKELSLQHEKVLFVGGMYHVERVMEHLERERFPMAHPRHRPDHDLFTLCDESCRDVLAECGWISRLYEQGREASQLPIDRQKCLYRLYTMAAKQAGVNINLELLMCYVRNIALVGGKLMPSLYEIVSAAKGCVDDEFAYSVWKLATDYPHLKNVDGLEEIDIGPQEVWGHAKKLHFRLKPKDRIKGNEFFYAPSPYTICSHTPEDVAIESLGSFLREKGEQLQKDALTTAVPFSSSLEDGIDVRETIRKWHERTFYVRVEGKSKGKTGAVIVIFDDDAPKEDQIYVETYPWLATWHGEHNQESDMAFYATDRTAEVVGPGISKCQYGGFLMSYPPGRLREVWSDIDYEVCKSKPEVLLAAGIDYAIDPTIVYVAAKPPRKVFSDYAARLGKKLVYLPMGQLSPSELKKIRHFHVLDGRDKRKIAGEYI